MYFCLSGKGSEAHSSQTATAEASQLICPVSDVPEFQTWPEPELWNRQSGTTRSRSFTPLKGIEASQPSR
jgi:hypothetical protein